MKLGQRIRAARQERGWLQYEFAKKLRTSQSTVSDWEHNVQRPSPANLRKLCRVLNWDYDSLRDEIVQEMFA